ncbi:MAG: ATP-dependent helicase RecQ [Pseudomonadota bacterium]|nr:ATP-dependent helicase RecQ [Pseudomonadota bacterium]
MLLNPSHSYDTPLHVLNQVFGYKTFRGDQEQIIHQVLSGGHAFVLMPTGGGKSLCYQIPALLFDGITVVISPLISLMQDQVATLQELGVAATYVASNLTYEQLRQTFTNILHNQIKLLYITPERLNSRICMDFLYQTKISLFAIDEAHCVSHWGHDFRPEYQQLSTLVNNFPHIPRLALTATADNYTQTDIEHYLGLKQARFFHASFLRENISYFVVEKNNAKKQLLDFVKQYKNQSGIVYCSSRIRVDMINQFLNEHGIDSRAYHAGLDASMRLTNHNYFLQSNNSVMVATVAFGLGIDKPDVRYVYHFDMPRSIDHFYQESGRAGRDGMEAVSVVNFGFKEILGIGQMIIESDNDELKKRYELAKLKKIIQYCGATQCRRVALLQLLGEQSYVCGKCDNCINSPKLYDATTDVQKILSTIYRVGQKFSASHITDILRAKLSVNVQIWEHHRLPTFGLCSELSEKELRRIIRQIYCRGIIDIDYTNSSLKLNDKSLPILRGLEDIHLVKHTVNGRSSCGSRNGNSRTVWLRTEIEERLYRDILSWRHNKAIMHKVSHHAILSERTIYELVVKKPHNGELLSDIYGIGNTKLGKFGNELIEIIQQHSHSHEVRNESANELLML